MRKLKKKKMILMLKNLFNKFKISIDLASNIYRDKNLLKDAENKQHETKQLE